MIPKIIHYCWLSGDPIPDDLQKWMATWKRVLPDYEFILWDKNRFDINSVAWVKEAYEAKKYAFAADYIRQYAVYTMGGIYMDMDVEVVRPFDELLNRDYMIGAEVGLEIEAGVFGAEKGCEIMQWCLDFYNNHHFKNTDGTLNQKGAPQVMKECIMAHKKIMISKEWECNNDQIAYILPFDYLTAKSGDTGVVKKTQNTRTVHHFAGSWLNKTIKGRIKRWLKVTVSNLLGESFSRKMSNVVNKK